MLLEKIYNIYFFLYCMANVRPGLVTFVCILGFIGIPLSVIFSLLILVAPDASAVPTLYPIFGILFALPYLAAMILVWKMKRIGLILYTCLAIVDYLVAIIFGYFSLIQFLVFLVILGALWTHFKNMD